jgi:hypothetical protein
MCCPAIVPGVDDLALPSGLPFTVAIGVEDEQVPIARARNFIDDNGSHESLKVVETGDGHNMKSLIDHDDLKSPNLVDLINEVYDRAMGLDGYDHEQRFPKREVSDEGGIKKSCCMS